MGDFFHRVPLLRGCLLGSYNILINTFSSSKIYSINSLDWVISWPHTRVAYHLPYEIVITRPLKIAEMI